MNDLSYGKDIFLRIELDIINKIVHGLFDANHPGILKEHFIIGNSDVIAYIDMEKCPYFEITEAESINPITIFLPQTGIRLFCENANQESTITFSCEYSCEIRIDGDDKLYITPLKGKITEINDLGNSNDNILFLCEHFYKHNDFLMFLVNEIALPILNDKLKSMIAPIYLTQITFHNKNFNKFEFKADKSENAIIFSTCIKESASFFQKLKAKLKKEKSCPYMFAASYQFITMALEEAFKSIDDIVIDYWIFFRFKGKPLSCSIADVSKSDLTINILLKTDVLELFGSTFMLDQRENCPQLKFRYTVDKKGAVFITPLVLNHIYFESKNPFLYIILKCMQFLLFILANGYFLISRLLNFLFHWLVGDIFKIRINLLNITMNIPPAIPYFDRIRKISVIPQDIVHQQIEKEQLIISGDASVTNYQRDRLLPGESLYKGEMLDNGKYILVYKSSNELVLYEEYIAEEKIVWRSFTKSYESDRLTMDTNGDLSLYMLNKPVWTIHTYCSEKCELRLDSECGLAIVNKKNSRVWSAMRKDNFFLTKEQSLRPGQYIKSKLKSIQQQEYYFVFATDGKIEVRNADRKLTDIVSDEVAKKIAGGTIRIGSSGRLEMLDKEGRLIFAIPETACESDTKLNISDWFVTLSGKDDKIYWRMAHRSRARLNSKEELHPGDCLISEGRAYALFYLQDGNIELFRIYDNKLLWRVDIWRKASPKALRMQVDGNLCAIDSGNRCYWAYNIYGEQYKRSYVVLEDSGMLVAYTGIGNSPFWNSKGMMKADKFLKFGDFLASPSGACRLVLQRDGNIVISIGENIIWASDTDNQPTATFLVLMRETGNLCAFSTLSGNTPYWSTNIFRDKYKDGYMILNDSGLLELYDASGSISYWNNRSILAPDRGLYEYKKNSWNRLISRNEQYELKFEKLSEDNNNFFIRQITSRKIIWNPAPKLTEPFQLTIQEKDGNLCAYNKSHCYWATNVYGSEYYKSYAVLENSGALILYRGSNRTPYWWSRTDMLPAGGELLPGQRLVSASNNYELVYREDGDVIILQSADGSICWEAGLASKTPGKLVLQRNGSLCAFDTQNTCYWKMERIGAEDDYFAVMEDSGGLVIYNADSETFWSSFNR